MNVDEYMEAQQEAVWDAEDLADSFDVRPEYINELRWHGYDEAWDLRYDMGGDRDIVCACCGEFSLSYAYESWDWEHGRNHLSWLYGI